MSTGTVKFFNDSKGFGFITEEGSDKDHGNVDGPDCGREAKYGLVR